MSSLYYVTTTDDTNNWHPRCTKRGKHEPVPVDRGIADKIAADANLKAMSLDLKTRYVVRAA
jgi:hypothetical protein